MNPVLDLLRSNGSIIISKRLARAIGINAAIMFSEIISKQDYFESRGQLTEDRYFYNTVDDMEIDTCLGEKPQKAAITLLKKMELIDCKVMGIPAKRHFKLIASEEKVLEILQGVQLRPKGGTKTSNREEFKHPKRRTNNTNVNNPNSNNPKENNVNNVTSLCSVDAKSFSAYKEKKDDDAVDAKKKYYSFSEAVQIVEGYENIENEIVGAIKYYFGQYTEYTGKQHCRYRLSSWENTFYRLQLLFNTYDMHAIEQLIDQYFQDFRYSDKTDKRILHFLNDGVLFIREINAGLY